jgi:uncharacterized membrane protein YgcG
MIRPSLCHITVHCTQRNQCIADAATQGRMSSPAPSPQTINASPDVTAAACRNPAARVVACSFCFKAVTTSGEATPAVVKLLVPSWPASFAPATVTVAMRDSTRLTMSKIVLTAPPSLTQPTGVEAGREADAGGGGSTAGLETGGGGGTGPSTGGGGAGGKRAASMGPLCSGNSSLPIAWTQESAAASDSAHA